MGVDERIVNVLGGQLTIEKIALCILIARTVQARQRQVDGDHGVLPVLVQTFMPFYRGQQALRRDMMLLAAAGILTRIGGVGCRRGYRVIEWRV